MDKKIIIAVAAVAIVAIAAAAILMGGSDDSETIEVNDSTRLLVYGNADQNYTIDENDVKALESMVANETPKTKYADANADGKVNEDDVTFLKKILDGTAKQVYYEDMVLGASPIDYPLDHICGVNQYVLLALCGIGAVDNMDGYVISNWGGKHLNILTELYENETNINKSYNMVDIEKLASLPEKPKYIITFEEELNDQEKILATGIKVVHMPFNKLDGMPSSVMTIGFLLGLEDMSKKYVDFIDKITNDVKTKVLDKVPMDDRKKTMSAYMSNCVDSSDGIYATASMNAGGINVTDWTGTYKQFNKGDEWVYDYDNEYLLYCNSWTYNGPLDKVAKYKQWSEYFLDTSAYKNQKMYCVNTVLPTSLLVAYTAEALYPELVGEGFGDAFNQEYIETFYPDVAKDFDITQNEYLITPDEVKDQIQF